MPKPKPIPTVRQYRLAQALRELREDSAMTQEQVATRMEWHTSKLFRLENARSPRVNWLDVQGLLDLYGVASPQRDALVQLAKDARKRGWWTPYQDVFTGSFVALEDEANLMRDYTAELVPGLLQTKSYAREVVGALRPSYDVQQVERRVAARMQRQERVQKHMSFRLDFIINESVIRRPVGGTTVMSEQLNTLVERADDPKTSVRILPYSAGAHAAMEGGFTLLSFPEEPDPDVVYIEGAMGDIYIESVEGVRRYTSMFEQLSVLSLSPAKTIDMMTAHLKELR